MSPGRRSRARAAGSDAPPAHDTVGRILRELSRYAEGVHRLAAPAVVLDSGLPAPLAQLYRAFDGGELFHESLTLLPSRQVRLASGRWQVGSLGADLLAVDAQSGWVWRCEEDTGEWLAEGTCVLRWLSGYVDAEAVVYELDGEFRDEVFTDEGELTETAEMDRERRLLRRDPRAPAPRWRLAQALAREGQIEAARGELEEVVAHAPGFAWAWYDLGRISERLGQVELALDEMCAAADADPSYAHVAFFLAHAARLAGRLDAEERRLALAQRALAADPALARAHREGAREHLSSGDLDSAEELIQLALAVAPADLQALDLAQTIEQARAVRGAGPM